MHPSGELGPRPSGHLQAPVLPSPLGLPALLCSRPHQPGDPRHFCRNGHYSAMTIPPYNLRELVTRPPPPPVRRSGGQRRPVQLHPWGALPSALVCKVGRKEKWPRRRSRVPGPVASLTCCADASQTRSSVLRLGSGSDLGQLSDTLVKVAGQVKCVLAVTHGQGHLCPGRVCGVDTLTWRILALLGFIRTLRPALYSTS